MRKTLAILTTIALLAVGAILTTTPAQASHSNNCTIHGAQKAYFGCGRVINPYRGGGTLKLQDTHTNGRCVRTATRNSDGQWGALSTQWCSGYVGYINLTVSGGNGDITGVRIYDGNTGIFRTINY